MLLRRLVTRVPAASNKVTGIPVASMTRIRAPKSGAPAAATPVTTLVPDRFKTVGVGVVGVVGAGVSLPPLPPPQAHRATASSPVAMGRKRVFIIGTVSPVEITRKAINSCVKALQFAILQRCVCR